MTKNDPTLAPSGGLPEAKLQKRASLPDVASSSASDDASLVRKFPAVDPEKGPPFYPRRFTFSSIKPEVETGS